MPLSPHSSPSPGGGHGDTSGECAGVGLAELVRHELGAGVKERKRVPRTWACAPEMVSEGCGSVLGPWPDFGVRRESPSQVPSLCSVNRGQDSHRFNVT